MQTIFSFKRVSQLIAAIWTEKRTLFIYSFLVILGLIIAALFYWVLFPDYAYPGTVFLEKRLITYYLVGLFLIAIFSGTAFSQLNSSSEKITWLMLPAKSSEKLGAVFILYVIIFTLLYSLCFLILSTTAISYVKELVTNHPGYSLKRINQDYGAQVIGIKTPKDTTYLKYGIYLYFIIQSFYICGTVYFRKVKFIKTAAVFIFFAIFLFFLRVGIIYLFGHSYVYHPYEYYLPRFHSPISWLNSIINTLFYAFWIPFFYWVIWLRLRRVEINSK